MNILETLQQRFAAALADVTDTPAEFAAMVKPSQDPHFGDFQANCAMPLAKRLGKPPRDVAAELIERLEVSDLCEAPDVAGPGFINLRLKDGWLQDEVNRITADERLGVPAAESPRRVVIDFSSPNVAKPMHVGHLRSTVIGDAIQRILRFLGHEVTSDNHIGDWGTQFGMIIYGYKHFRDDAAYRADAVGELSRLYRLVNTLSDYHGAKEKLPQLQERLERSEQELAQAEQDAEGKTESKSEAKKTRKKLSRQKSECDELRQRITETEARIAAVEKDRTLSELAAAHPNIARAARDETAALHAGDETNTQLWNEFLPACLNALQTVYDRLDIHFDEACGESFYQPQLASVVESLSNSGLAVESEGATCVFIEGNDAPFIVRKADGAFTYATTDLATIRRRVDELHAEQMLYVVDARQSEHFKLLFETARQWGYDADFRHVSFGTVMGEDGKPFKTRAGDAVGLAGLLDEAVQQALQIVEANDEAKPNGPELDSGERAQVAERVGIGGIKYADLQHNRESDYVFSWEKMLAKNGDTATYMQYAFARTQGILRKANESVDSLIEAGHEIVLSHPAERALVLHLCRFADALQAVVSEYRPNLLTAYLFETANRFSTFYDNCPVVAEENESLRASRLLLVQLTGRVIQQGLALLGIQTCKRM